MFSRFFKFHLFLIPCFWLSSGLAQAATDCAASSTPKIECEALLALYNSTNGPNWASKVGWNVTNDPCTWVGITCSSEENIIEIRLASNRLSGPLPPELGNLVNLQSLDLSHNQLSGSLPPEWGNLVNLQYLYLSHNQLSGSLPPEWGNLVNLRYLYLYGNQLSGSLPPEWGNLVNLQELYLNNNRLSGSLPLEWGNLVNLKYLSLSNNQLFGSLPPEWGNLVNLRYLYLYSNQLFGSLPPEWGNLVNLRYLYLYSNQLFGSLPPEWGNLVNLQELYLNNNRLSGSLPPEWGNLVNLQYLSLSKNQLSGSLPPKWGNLVNLQRLYLYNNQLSGSLPPELGNLIQLQILNLNGNQLTGNLPETFTYLVRMSNLTLNYNLLTAEESVTTFVTKLNSGWQRTQTVPPTAVTTTGVANDNIQVQWVPILYQANGGYYEVGYATTPGGPYTFQPVSGDKSTVTHFITGLSPNTSYYIVVRTYTPPHDSNQNPLTSDISAEVSATTLVEDDTLVGNYFLSVTLNGQGTVNSTPSGIQCGSDCSENYPSGTTVTLTATPDPGYAFDTWSGACTDTQTNTKVTLDTTDKTCSATFVPLQSLLQINLVGQGTVDSTPPGIQCGSDCSENYPLKTTVTLTATPGPGYAFDTWSGACTGTQTSIEVTLDTTDEICFATFIPLPLLQINLIGQGTVDSTPPGIQCGSDCSENYPPGTTVTLTATPNPGYAFDIWSGACIGTQTSTEVTLNTTDETCSATFVPLQPLLQVNLVGQGTVDSTPPGIQCGSDCSENYPLGTTVTLTATPNPGYAFDIWSGACTGTRTSTEVTLDTIDETCSATFVPLQPLLQVNLVGQGTVDSTPPGIQCGSDCSENYSQGTTVTLTATPDPGYAFDTWSGACTGTRTSTEVTLDTIDETCSATFIPLQSLLQINLVGQGTVDSTPPGIQCGSDCSENYPQETIVTLTAIPALGYIFDHWEGQCNGTNTNIEVTIEDTTKCSATFVPIPFLQISISGQGNVNSQPIGIQCGSTCEANYPPGTSVTLSATPTPGYKFDGWGGNCSGTIPTATIILNTHQSCVATFTEINRSLTVSLLGSGLVFSNPPGIICEPDCSQDYPSTTLVTLTAKPAANIRFDKWSGDCSGQTLNTTVTLETTKHCTAEFLNEQDQSIANPGYLSQPDHLTPFNFGQSKIGQSITFSFEIVEVGNLPLEVRLQGFSGSHASDFALLTPTFPLILPDGAAHQPVTLQCTPTAPGLQTAELTFTSNDPTNPLITYLLQCTGVEENLSDNPLPKIIGVIKTITLSNKTIAANTVPSTVIGQLETVAEGFTKPRYHYTLLEDAGGRFKIVGNELILDKTLSFEQPELYWIIVRSSEETSGLSLNNDFVLYVLAVNHPPLDIQLSNQVIGERSQAGELVGTLSTPDPDVNDTHTYQLKSGGQFIISGNEIRIAEGIQLAYPDYTLQVISTDGGGLSVTKSFTITVQSQPRFVGELHTQGRPIATQVSIDAPETVTLIGKFSPSVRHLGQLADIQAIYHWTPNNNTRPVTITQPLAHQQRLETEWVGTLFQNRLIGLAGQFEVSLNYQVGQEVYTAPIATLTVRPNRPPLALKLSNDTVLENSPSNTLVGTLSTEDLDVQEEFTYSLMENPGQHFKITGNELRTTAWVLDQQQVKLVVRSFDLVGDFVDSTMLIRVVGNSTSK